MLKKITVSVFTVFLVLLFAATVFADGHMKCGPGKDKGWEDKIFFKADMMIKNQEELGLSDEQAKKIKELKSAAKKELIRKDAEIDILAVDIKEKMYEDKMDVQAMNDLIDEKYKLKAAKAKYMVKTYADLKNTLTAEQQKELKGLCKKLSR